MDALPLSLQLCVLENVSVQEEIGRGNYGRVLAATWEGTPVAVKNVQYLFDIVPSEFAYEELQQTFLKECERSSQLRHPNIVRFLGICLTETSPIPQLVMERLSSNLNQLLIKHPVISEGTKYNILHGVSLGIRYLHSRRPFPIIHRDLSSNNVLVSSAMEGKIGDLATAQFVHDRKKSQDNCGTPDFLPPEVLTETANYTVSVDVFSFGCIMIHTLVHEWPIPKNAVVGDPKTRMLRALSELERRETYMQKLINRPGSIPDQVKNIIVQCLENYPGERPKIETVTEVLQAISRIEKLKEKMKLRDRQISPLPVEKSNSFWNSLKVTRQQCPDLLIKCWPTSIAKLDGKVYIIAEDSNEATYPYAYDLIKQKWSRLSALPYHKCSLVSVPDQKQLLAIGGCKKTEVSGQIFEWDDANWVVKYPNMPTARFSSSSTSHELTVIVAGGITCCDPWTMTNAVEILLIKEVFSQFRTHTWVKVKQLPYAVYGTVPLIVHDNLYIAGGFDKQHHGTCKIATASLSELKKSGSSANNVSPVWSRLPDMPYSSFSVNHYQGHLITFTGVSLGEQPTQDKPILQLHLYNPDKKSWDYVATASEGYIWGRSVHIKDDVIFVVGGTTSTIYRGKDDNLMKTCLMLSFSRRGRIVLHNAF